jgi:hypothetical protein
MLILNEVKLTINNITFGSGPTYESSKSSSSSNTSVNLGIVIFVVFACCICICVICCVNIIYFTKKKSSKNFLGKKRYGNIWAKVFYMKGKVVLKWGNSVKFNFNFFKKFNKKLRTFLPIEFI